MEDITRLDLYALLEISSSASEQQIRKAFRKKALSCHPDKNPDNPRAAELFHQLSRALEVLLDASAKAAYDSVLRARKATELRNRELDCKRKKLKDDLEARERAAHVESARSHVDPAEALQREIERLRREGCRQVEEEQELLRNQVREERERLSERIRGRAPRLKVRWKVDKNGNSNGIVYTRSVLLEIFSKYGEVACVVISERHQGRALVEFSTFSAAEMALQHEVGYIGNPLTVTWVHEKKGARKPAPPVMPTMAENTCGSVPVYQPMGNPYAMPQESSTISSRDYESLVLMKLRQAEERKMLIEQMMRDDENK